MDYLQHLELCKEQKWKEMERAGNGNGKKWKNGKMAEMERAGKGGKAELPGLRSTYAI